MRERILTGGSTAVLLMTLAIGVSAQTGDGKADDKTTKSPVGPVTLAGCVERGTNPNEYTIDDGSGGKYRVSGSRIDRYLGQRVEVVGNVDTGRLKIRTGLYPSPNVAGQAGAMDPVKAAIAAQPGGTSSGTGAIDLPAVKVRSVKTLDRGCR
jgi:hypothetical protein